MIDQFSVEFASHWDELVGWEERSAADTSFLLGLMRRFECRNVLDVALGTGFHSVKLLNAGLEVKSVDVSPAMIEIARGNAARHSAKLDVICTDWVDLSKKVTEKFDCILCLGNSLACEMDSDRRQEAVKNWSGALSDEGIVIVDRRNYEAMLAGEYNRNSKGQYFGEAVKITFSEISADGTVFSYTFSDGKTFDLNMFPILDQQIRSIFSNSDLQPVEVYGDRKLSYVGQDVGFYMYIFRKMKRA